MRKSFILLLILLLGACGNKEPSYMGSRSCRECHEAFYTLWETSYHGRAMQDFTADLHEKHLTPCDSFIVSGNEEYRYIMTDSGAYMAEAGSGKQYPLLYALGGKYVYYFLTPRENGKLQTLPLGYDVGKKEWFDITASSIRMHQSRSDAALPWTDRRYTFNTACYACHVSQLSSEYDINRDSYTSEWREAGINCETCHGPAETHNRIFREAEKRGSQLQETYLKTVVQSKGYTAEQVNASCSYCHAKMISLTPEYIPGETFFRHFDLITYENPDHYPDGRDLGENYTFTSWRMSPCVQNNDMDCLHCHTSSGRYRQKEDPNASCLPCHSRRVEHAGAHSRHPEGSEGSICIHCHMPKTEFARMTRSDHSMRPPMPAATRAYGPPNACNLCHTGKPRPGPIRWSRSVIREATSPKPWNGRAISTPCETGRMMTWMPHWTSCCTREMRS
ncbi:MAG: cytochrome c3 family protein [Candidatus Marinimicrobia bacterium]|nr:cytochrome c3 family protein [Candidatus Neomarinimicrobiota bacterium]